MKATLRAMRQRRAFGHFLACAHLDIWARLLWANQFAVGVKYVPRLAFSLVISANATFWAWPERLFFALWRSRRPTPPPIFIVGYFRSGTTLLHSLLARDPRLAYPTNVQALSPHGFIFGALGVQPVLRLFRSLRRPMDDMPYAPDEPQEEEFALAAMGAPSAYGRLCFPRNAAHYYRFVHLDRATPAERHRWARDLHRFVGKVALWRKGRRVVLKSPYNTARVRHLLQVFPDAQFIHIHRNPFDVVRSAVHTSETLVPLYQLQDPPATPNVEEEVAREYAEVEAAFQRDKVLLTPDRLAEVAFEGLERDPVGEVRRIYRELGLDFHTEYERRLVAYVESLAGYRKNRPPATASDSLQKVAPILQPLLQRWGYPGAALTDSAR